MSVQFADIEAAAARLAGHAVRTPLIESPALNDRLGMRVLIKPETFDAGIRDLYRTSEDDGVFCYTFFKAVGEKSATPAT